MSSLFALAASWSFIASSLNLSKQTVYHLLCHPTAGPHLRIIFTSPLTCFRNLVITNGVLPDEFGGVPLLAEVRLQEGESLENALRRFKRKVQQEDIIKEVKRHSFYLKPGEKKRVKAALARKRARKKTRKEQD